MSRFKFRAIKVILGSFMVWGVFYEFAEVRTPRQSAPQEQASPEQVPADLTEKHTPPPNNVRLPRFVITDDGNTVNSVGTAFAIDDQGLWITARHVVGGCDYLVFRMPKGRPSYLTTQVWINPLSDTALVEGPKAEAGFPIAAAPDGNGANAYHVGFPQAKPGDVWSKVIGPGRMVTRGVHRSDEPVVAYAVVKRFPSFTGTLGGISGGPIFDSDGQVVGVSVAESPRKGRIIGAVPQSFERLYQEAGKRPANKAREGSKLTPSNVRDFGDRVRRSSRVARVYCGVS